MKIDEFDIKSLWSLSRRRFVWILIPLVAGVSLAALAVRLTPAVYQASTLILVEEQKVPSSYVRATVTSNINERLKSLKQQITSRDALEKTITEVDIYPDLQGRVGIDQLVARAKRDLSVRVLPGNLFEISFKGPDAEAVAIAVNLIADQFIEENLLLRARHAANTSSFLEGELQETRVTLEDREQQLVNFRMEYDGMLPEQRQANFNAIEQLQTKLQINRSEKEQMELRKAILDRDNRESADGSFLSDPKEKTRLDDLELELSALKAKFTSNHPDVVRLQAEIDQLVSQEELIFEDVSDLQVPSQDSRLDAEIKLVDASLDRLQREGDRLLEQIATYQRRIEMTSKVEQQLTSITRDYDNLRDSYESLLNKRIEARLAEDLERKQQSEQFRKLEEARTPTRPISPHSPFYLLVGSFLGGMLGIGLALIRDQTDETLDSEEAVKRAFPGVTFVVTIPHLDVSLGDRPSADEVDRTAEMA